MRLGQVEGDPQAVNGGRETAEEKLLLGAGEDFVQPRLHRPLARRVSGPVDVGRVLQQSQHAPFTVLRKAMQIERLAVRGREVDLEVAGVHDDADRGLDGQGDAVHQAVGHTNGLDGESAEVKLLPWRDLDQLGCVEQPVLFELALDVGQSELGRINRHLQLTQNPGQATDMVFVAMGKDDGANVLAVFDEVGNIGYDNVNPQQLGLGKHETGIDDDYVVCPAECQAVHSEFAQPAQRDDL